MFIWQTTLVKQSMGSSTNVTSLQRPLFGTALTSYTSSPDFIVSDTSHYGDDYGWMAFDAQVPRVRSMWHVYGPTSWLMVECVDSKVLGSLRVYQERESPNTADAYRYRPISIEVQSKATASSTWENVGTYPLNYAAAGRAETYISDNVSVNWNKSYKFYRFRISGGIGGYVSLVSLMLSEASAIDYKQADQGI